MHSRGLLPFGALALLVLGCPRVTGVRAPLGAPERAWQSQVGSGAGNDTTVDINLESGDRPNPVMRHVSVRAEMPASKDGLNCGFEVGDFMSAAPSARVTIAEGSEHLVIEARSDISGLLLLSTDGEFFCATNKLARTPTEHVRLKPRDLKAGTYDLRVMLDHHSQEPIDVVLAFHNPTRGVLYDDTVFHQDLDGPIQRPLFFAGNTWSGDGYRRGDRYCTATYGPMPQTIFHSERRIDHLSFMALWSPKPFEIRIQDLPGNSQHTYDEGWCISEPGSVNAERPKHDIAVHVGNGHGGESRPFGYVVTSRSTVVDPFRLSPVARPKHLTVVDRKLGNHFPFLGGYLAGRRDHRYSLPWLRPGAETDKARQRLFLVAPQELFVAAKVDLDETSVRSTDSASFPNRGETLLVSAAHPRAKYATIYRADGAQYKVLLTALAHPASYAVPLKTRQIFSTSTSLGFAGPEDQPRKYALFDKQDAYASCFERMTAKAAGQIAAIDNTRQRATTFNKRRKAQLWDAAKTAAEQGCQKAELDALEAETRKNVATARQRRINDRLAKIAARLANF